MEWISTKGHVDTSLDGQTLSKKARNRRNKRNKRRLAARQSIHMDELIVHIDSNIRGWREFRRLPE